MRSIVPTIVLTGMLFAAACKQRSTELITLTNTRLDSAFHKAKELNKGLLLVSNKAGCGVCEMFEADIIKNADFAETLGEHFVLLRTNESIPGEQWLARILNKGSFPVFLFFDKDARLRHLELGRLTADNARKITDRIANTSESTADPKFEIEHDKKVPAAALLQYFEVVCKGHAAWESYQLHKDTALLRPIRQQLLQTLPVYTTFYNNYLLAKIESALQDSTPAQTHARAALAVEEPAALYFNAPLRTEMKMVMNSHYSQYDEAYMGVDDLNRNIGKVAYRSSNRVAFNIRNLGKSTLVIGNTYSDCDCTMPGVKQKSIAPGDTGIVEIVFKANRMGEFSHFVQLSSNASNSPMELTIKGLVLGD